MAKIKAGNFYMCLEDISGYDSFTKGKVYSSINDNALINDNHIEVKVTNMNSKCFRIATDKQVFKAKLDRLKEETSIGLSEHDNGVETGRMEVINALYRLLDSMQEEPTSVWHDANTLPSDPKAVIVEHNEYSTSICRAEQMSRVKGAKWAYINDLLKL